MVCYPQEAGEGGVDCYLCIRGRRREWDGMLSTGGWGWVVCYLQEADGRGRGSILS